MDHEIKLESTNYKPAPELLQKYKDWFTVPYNKMSYIREFELRKTSHNLAYMICVIAGEVPDLFWSSDRKSLIDFQTLRPELAAPFRAKLDELYEGVRNSGARKMILEKALRALAVEIEEEPMRV